MTYNPEIHNRQSHRLNGFNYNDSGAYFITICTQNRSQIFGCIKCGEMHLNNSGKIIQQLWNELPLFYPNIEIDEFIIMPDHIHGIIIVGAAPCGRPDINACGRPDINACGRPDINACGRPDINTQFFAIGQPQGVAPTAPLSLSEAVHRFKSLSTRRLSDTVKNGESPCFPGRLWQRNYWERIIRNEHELHAIRNYIRSNPTQWQN